MNGTLQRPVVVIVKAAPLHVESVRRHIFDQLTARQVSQLADIVTAVVARHDS